MSFRQDGDAGGAYLETQQALGRIFAKYRPILILPRPFPIFRRPPSDSVCLRHHPLSAGSFRFGSLLVRVADGNMCGGQDGDVGRAYLERQQAIGQICGENRPTLVLSMPFFASINIRLIPPASAICRRLPPRVASVPCV